MAPRQPTPARTVSPLSTIAGWAGILGPLLFTASFLVQEAFRREEYSPVAEQVSALEAGPNGWIQQVTFVVLGALTLVHAVGLHRGIAPTRFGFVGPALFGLTGIGAVIAGLLPLREDAAGVTYDPGGHIVGGMLFFVGAPLAFLALSRRLRSDARWRALAPYAVAAGAALLVSAVVMNVLVIPDDAAWHDQAGLAQRIIVLGLVFPMRIALGVRLIRAG